MSFANIILFIYKIFLFFIIYYVISWVYVKVGGYIMDYLVAPAFFPFVFFNWRYLKNNSELNPQKNHIAIVLCNNYMPERVLSYREDIPKLVKYFKKNNWSYKIYFRADEKTMKEVIKNKKATIVYILGHGQRHGVKVSSKSLVYYCEFEKSPKKKFIAQLHCNHYGGKSLAEYLSNSSVNNFVTNKKLSSIGINKFIERVVKGEVHQSP